MMKTIPAHPPTDREDEATKVAVGSKEAEATKVEEQDKDEAGDAAMKATDPAASHGLRRYPLGGGIKVMSLPGCLRPNHSKCVTSATAGK
jgi:hypothetical protein